MGCSLEEDILEFYLWSGRVIRYDLGTKQLLSLGNVLTFDPDFDRTKITAIADGEEDTKLIFLEGNSLFVAEKDENNPNKWNVGPEFPIGEVCGLQSHGEIGAAVQ
jgi:hypothetical protein